MDLSVSYMGLSLPGPVIVGSSGLTAEAGKIAELAKHGAGAVVLKSIFEEEIMLEYEKLLAEEAPSAYRDDYLDYFDYRIREENLEKYVKLVADAKKAVDIPVIASINCQNAHEWTYFAGKIEKAGADAIELNIAILPTSLDMTTEAIEQRYLEIINAVKNEVRIPLSIKIGWYFSNPGRAISTLSATGIKGMVLFNRFYSPDIDPDKMEVVPASVFSSPLEQSIPLRWIGIMSKRVKCDLAASTGVHDGTGVIKQLLAGASAVQVVSALYRHGPSYLQNINEEIREWMEGKGYESIDQFRGLLSQERYVNPALYERVQFMKYFSDREKYQ